MALYRFTSVYIFSEHEVEVGVKIRVCNIIGVGVKVRISLSLLEVFPANLSLINKNKVAASP